MFQVNPRRVCLLAVVCLALAAISSPAPAQVTQKMSLKQMVDNSDLIVVGECAEKKVDVQNGHLIVTQYKIKPSEFWKGNQNLDRDGTFAMTEIGGSLSDRPGNIVPLAQFAPAMSNMAPGEQVLLFMATPQSRPAPGTRGAGKTRSNPKFKSTSFHSTTTLALEESPAVVGGWQGRYSVVTNPTSGGRLVARANMSATPGSQINTALRDKIIKSQGIKTTLNAAGAKVAVQDPNVKLAAEKMETLTQQINTAAVLAKKQHEELVHTAKGEITDDIYSFESMDAVKTRVLRIVKSSKP